MRWVISAAGDGARWANHGGVPKHLALIDGRPVVHATVDKIHSVDATAEVVVIAPPGDARYKHSRATVVDRPEGPTCTDVDKFLAGQAHWAPDSPTALLFGDVNYTPQALTTIAATTTDTVCWFGRFNPSALTGARGGEIWAVLIPNHQAADRFTTAAHHIAHLITTRRVRDTCAGWRIHRHLGGAHDHHLNNHATYPGFVEVNDWTEDFDWPPLYDAYVQRRNIPPAPLRIASVSVDYPPNRFVGAETSQHELHKQLAARGHDVRVFTLNPTPNRVYEGVSVEPIRNLTGWAPDIVYNVARTRAQLPRLPHRPPVVGFVHSLAQQVTTEIRRVRYDLLVFNTAWFAREAQHLQDGYQAQAVLYPLTPPAQPLGAPGEHITMINPIVKKGAPTLHALATTNPHRTFLVVEGGYSKQEVPDGQNVTRLPHGPDMNQVWAQTRVLIVPSRRETWGMVAVEAAARGIPVISADLPGPREANVACAFHDPADTDAWNTTLTTLDDPTVYARESHAARQRHAHLWQQTVHQLDYLEQASQSLVHGTPVPRLQRPAHTGRT